MFPKNLNMDKLAKEMLAAAIASSEADAANYRRKAKACLQDAAELRADAANYERKAKASLQLVNVFKKFGSTLVEMLKPPKPFTPPKMTRKQKAAMKKAMKNFYPSSVPYGAGAVVTSSPVRPS